MRPGTARGTAGRWALALGALLGALVAGCGGGGDAPVTPPPTPPPPPLYHK